MNCAPEPFVEITFPIRPRVFHGTAQSCTLKRLLGDCCKRIILVSLGILAIVLTVFVLSRPTHRSVDEPPSRRPNEPHPFKFDKMRREYWDHIFDEANQGKATTKVANNLSTGPIKVLKGTSTGKPPTAKPPPTTAVKANLSARYITKTPIKRLNVNFRKKINSANTAKINTILFKE